MRRRPLLAAALTGAVVLGPWAFAAPAAPAPQVTDPENDANYLNDNSPLVLPAEHPFNNNPTPVGSDGTADILSIEWATLKSTPAKPKKGKKAAAPVVKGFTVTMALKEAPGTAGVLYRATAETADCTQLWFQYYTDAPSTTPQASLRHTCDGGVVVVPVATAVVGKTIVWTFEFGAKDLPKVVKAGTDIIDMGGHSRDYVSNPTCIDASRCTTNPTQIDVTNNVPGPYKVGS
ncbi:MAG TPA: hypothetical protein VNB94_04495 [Mycobacteriales bacterium]|nr:hypothetical protein [Mycobacteriales bacterium]